MKHVFKYLQVCKMIYSSLSSILEIFSPLFISVFQSSFSLYSPALFFQDHRELFLFLPFVSLHAVPSSDDMYSALGIIVISNLNIPNTCRCTIYIHPFSDPFFRQFSHSGYFTASRVYHLLLWFLGFLISLLYFPN